MRCRKNLHRIKSVEDEIYNRLCSFEIFPRSTIRDVIKKNVCIFRCTGKIIKKIILSKNFTFRYKLILEKNREDIIHWEFDFLQFFFFTSLFFKDALFSSEIKTLKLKKLEGKIRKIKIKTKKMKLKLKFKKLKREKTSKTEN